MEGAEEGGYNGRVLRRSTARDSFSLMPWIKRGFEKKKKNSVSSFTFIGLVALMPIMSGPPAILSGKLREMIV